VPRDLSRAVTAAFFQTVATIKIATWRKLPYRAAVVFASLENSMQN
jgi:hypothetical protein